MYVFVQCTVVRDILDEPIPLEERRCSPKPLRPRNYRPSAPPRKVKERKRKAIAEEFDAVVKHQKPVRSTQDYQTDIVNLLDDVSKTGELVFRQTPWAIGNFLCGWQMDVPEGHGGPRAFLEEIKPQIQGKLEEELKDLWGEGG